MFAGKWAKLLSAEPFWVRRLAASPTYNPRRLQLPCGLLQAHWKNPPPDSYLGPPPRFGFITPGSISSSDVEPGLLRCCCSPIWHQVRVPWAGQLRFYGLALFFNYPHYMATIYRAYHTAEDFHKYRIFTVHITALVALTLVLSHFWFRALPWIFTLYLIWSPWHYSGQNYGLFMMFARRGGATPSAAGRRALYSAFLISYLILLLGFLTGPSNDPLFVSPAIPRAISSAAALLLGVAFAGLFGVRLVRAGGTAGLAAPASVDHTFFHTVSVVSFAHAIVRGGETATAAEPLQQRSVRHHALGPVSLDHQLLRSS